MAPNDFCRLCKMNMREAVTSVLRHATDMFLSQKTTTSVSERLALSMRHSLSAPPRSLIGAHFSGALLASSPQAVLQIGTIAQSSMGFPRLQ